MTKSRSKQGAPPKAQVARWFQAARNGESSAVAQLLEAYRPLLLKLANAQLNPELRQKMAASDLVQNSIIKASVAFAGCEFQSVQDVISWLQEILANEVIAVHRWYRKAKKRDTRRERPINSVYSRMWIDYLSIHSQTEDSVALSREEVVVAVRLALDRLPPHYRKVITWRYADGLTFPQIGSKVGCSGDAARMLWNRAMKRLKEEYRGPKTF